MTSKKTQYLCGKYLYYLICDKSQSIFEILNINNKKSTKLYTQK